MIVLRVWFSCVIVMQLKWILQFTIASVPLYCIPELKET